MSGQGRALGALAAATVAVLVVVLLVIPHTARAAWQELARFLSLVGDPEPASANVLSEHEIEALDQLPPQSQAELLLERSINHYRGANEQIVTRVDGWRGRIAIDGRLDMLFTTALNSGDLRVRAAAIEVNLAGRDLAKQTTTMDRLEPTARSGERLSRINALWDIALLGNRGVAPERAAEILLTSLADGDEQVRYWAVEGLAYLGSDTVTAPLLDVLRSDPSPLIRERAACGLAQSGMLSERQRRRAVPNLLDLAEDPALDALTRKWVFQALRDITGQSLPHDPGAWREWYASAGDRAWNPVTRDQ